MKKTKQILSVLLAACLLLCCAPLALAETPAFSDPASAAAYIRSGMLARETDIAFTYHADLEEIGELTGEALSGYFSSQWNRIEEIVFSHTGTGDQGDYLLNHLVKHGYSYSVSYSSLDDAVNYEVAATAVYHTTAAQEAEMTKAVADALKSLRLDGKSAYEKIRAINDFICDTTEYDYANLNDDSYDLKYSAYAALINGTSVCQGYASLFYRMALEAGLDARIISGSADNGEQVERHAWNIVRLGNKYYSIDVTWNDGTRSDQYFLIGQDGFRDHFPDEQFTGDPFASAYPIAEKAYRPGDEAQGCAGRHVPATDPAVPATCTKDGRSEGSHCSLCGEVLKAQTVVKAAGHKWDEGKITTPAACTRDGVKTFTCAVCKETKTETIKATGHKAVVDAAVAASCTGDGKTEGSHCSVCGEVLKAQTVIKAAGHQWDDGKVTKEATEQAEGERTFTCTVCGETKQEAIPKKTPASETYARGDVDNDGKITSADARLALRASVKLEKEIVAGAAAYIAADVNQDGKVGSDDARTILRVSVKLEAFA